MIAGRLRLLAASRLASDFAAALAASALAAAIVTLTATMDVGGVASVWLRLAGITVPIWIAVFAMSGLYGTRRSTAATPSRALKPIVIAGCVTAGTLQATRLEEAGATLLLVLVSSCAVLVLAGRALAGRVVLAIAAPRRVIVAGDRDEVLQVIGTLRSCPEWGFEVVGIANDGSWSETGASERPIVATYRQLPETAQDLAIDDVVVALDSDRLEHVRALEPMLLQLEEQGLVVRFVTNLLPQSSADVSLERFGPLPLLTFSTAPRQDVLLFIRRCLDAGLAAALVVVLSPIFLIIALAIKLTSKGPVLFRQTRCGLNGRRFTFVKFRSMGIDAEQLKASLARYNEMTGPAFKMTRDPRVTAVGRVLRRLSVDELPQLWNILKGDMSFVGPRPAVVEEVARYEPWQRRRLSMKPGLTCLWQVSGREVLSFDEWVRLDLEYIDNWSLWLDLKIAVKTIPVVLLGRGAR